MDRSGAGSTWNRVDLSAASIYRRGDDRRANARDESERGTASENRVRVSVLRWRPLVPLSAWVRAGSDSRRTAVVEAVEKVQRCVVSISSEKMAVLAQSLAVFARGEPAAAGQRHGERRARRRPRLHPDQPPRGRQSPGNRSSSCSTERTYPARVLQIDPVMDLAVLKIDADHVRWRRSRSARRPT